MCAVAPLLSPQVAFSSMAKITNMVGLAKGKTGSIVYSVRGGEQIARAYNPYVANPNTVNQMRSRAKLKLLSQVSAAVAPVIAIPKQGAVSARNLFTKVNYKFTSYVNSAAQLKLADMQLTDSAVGIEGFVADRTSGTKIHCALTADMSLLYDAVVWVVIAKMSSGQLFPFADAVVEDAGIGGTFPVDLPFTDGDISVHCYGIKTKSAAAAAAYSKLGVATAAGIAQIIANREVKAEDLGLSETRGVYMPQGVNQQETSGQVYNAVRISIVDENGNAVADAGVATGAGNYEDGAQVTIEFTPAQGVTFLGWRISGITGMLQNNPYSFIAGGDVSIQAVVRVPVDAHTAQALFTSNSSTSSAALTGGGMYEPGTQVTFGAPTVGGNVFRGWYSDQAGTTLVSANANYQFEMPNANYALYAKYEVSVDQN